MGDTVRDAEKEKCLWEEEELTMMMCQCREDQ